MDWESFIRNILAESGNLVKDEIIDLVNGAIADDEEFIRAIGLRMESYLGQLALGKITKEEFEMYMVDIADLAKMQGLKMEAEVRVRSQRIADGIRDLILGQLLRYL